VEQPLREDEPHNGGIENPRAKVPPVVKARPGGIEIIMPTFVLG
jgi:hypothetical protein